MFTLTPRNPEKRIVFGGNKMAFGLVAGPPNAHDCINGRRDGNLVDYKNFTRLAHHFNAIHLLGNQVVAPVELPANTRHLETYMANIELSDLVYHCSAIGRGRPLDGIRMMAISRGMTVDDMRTDPAVTTIISVNSPRRFDEAMANGLITMSEYGQAVAVTPFTLMGAMTPVTLAAGLGPAKRRGTVRPRSDPARQSWCAGVLWRLHLERRHAFGCAGIRNAGKYEGQYCQRSARAPIRCSLSRLADQCLEQRRRAGDI